MAEMFFTMMCLDMAEPIALLIFSGVLERHPGLRFVIAESGIGWIPFVVERMDYTFDRHRLWSARNLVLHNVGKGPKIEDVLFRWRITGHYRYYGPALAPDGS